MNNNQKHPTARRKKPTRKKKSGAFGKFVGGMFFFVLFYVIIAVMCILMLFLAVSCRHRDPQPSESDITVVTSQQDEKSGEIKPVEIKPDIQPVKEVAKKEKSPYLPMSVFGMLGADVTPAGDPIKSITVNLNDVGEWASFNVDSDKVNVNGNDITLKAKSVVIDGELYIPIDFFTSLLRGVTVSEDENGYTVKANGLEPISFVNKPVEPTPDIPAEDANGVEEVTSMFITDISRYEQYIDPQNRDDYLFLVNVNNLLASDFVPEDLCNVKYTKPDRAKQQMSRNAQIAADAMIAEAHEQGYDNLWVTSAYRSYNTQSWLFDEEVEIMKKEYGEELAVEKAKESVNPPGASEHQSGLTADMHTLSSASLKFAGTPAAEWLEENCRYFGFILRYPEDKTEITGIMYEPWHFRFVGRYHAMQIYRLGMCLEEYVEYLEENTAQ